MITGFDPALTIAEVEPLFPELIFLDMPKPGSEGAVFQCRDTNTDKEILLKIYGPNRLMRRTELEISKMQVAQSPYLAGLVSSGKKTIRSVESYYLMTEFINGNNLGELLTTGYKITGDQAKKLILNISHAIQELWGASVVHSDIKPDNIILSSAGDFILIDLGVAKHLDAEPITELTVLCYGTQGYLAPEQYTGRKNLTLRADFYSLGITAWQSLAGYHPFAYNQAIMNQPLPPIPKGTIISDKVVAVINKLAQPTAYRRPISFADISKQIKGDK